MLLGPSRQVDIAEYHRSEIAKAGGFVARGGVAILQQINIGRNNGVEAQVLGGIEVGENVVLYLSSQLTDGAKVTQRTLE